MFKFENEVDAKLAIYEACMNGEITEAQKDSLMMSLNKKLGKVLLEKIKSGMKFKYAGDTYIAKGSVTYQTVSGVKIPTLKVQKEDGTVTNLQFDPEEDKAVRLVKESADETGNYAEFDAFIESVDADVEYLTEAANAASVTSKLMSVVNKAASTVKSAIAKVKDKVENKKELENLEYSINGLEGAANELEMVYKQYKKEVEKEKNQSVIMTSQSRLFWNNLIKTKKRISSEIETAEKACAALGEPAKEAANKLAKIKEEYQKMDLAIGNEIAAAENK